MDAIRDTRDVASGDGGAGDSGASPATGARQTRTGAVWRTRKGRRNAEPAGPVGRVFPSVWGTALSGEALRLPHDLQGAPALLLVAYRRAAQADVDRWATFLRDTTPALRVLELPVIPAILWRPLQGWIDGGMRGGVPRPQWSNVITVYEDGATVRAFVGDRGAAVAHAVLLDAGGTVRALETDGFDDDDAARLSATIAELAGS